ncbi:MAG: hypothetical protein NXI10_00850 [bacterium]|nr:hypothetical protein [bacterium]
MNKFVTKNWVEEYNSFSVQEALSEKIHGEHNYTRTSAIIHVAMNINNSYSEYSKALLTEMNNQIHFDSYRQGIPSAWVLALALAENLEQKDYLKLKNAFAKWPKEEKKQFLNWIEGHTEQMNILQYGKIDP